MRVFDYAIFAPLIHVHAVYFVKRRKKKEKKLLTLIMIAELQLGLHCGSVT